MIKSFYTSLSRPANWQTDNPPGKQRLFSTKLVVRLCVSVGILVFLIMWLSTESLLTAIRSVPAQLWVLVVSGFIVGHVISALKWRMMIKAMGTNVRINLAIRAHGAGLFANFCLPSIVGGDFIRAALVIREQKSNMAAIALGSLADRINDTFALLIIASLACFLMPATQLLVTGNFLTILASTLLLGVFASIMFVRLVPKSILPNFLHNPLDSVEQALDSLIANPLTALFGLIMSLLIQGSFVGLNIMLANAMSIEASVLLWMFAWPMAKLVALAPISLGGIGVREAALAGILAPFGIEASLAVAQSLSWEVVLIFTGVLSGIAVAMYPSQLTTGERSD